MKTMLVIVLTVLLSVSTFSQGLQDGSHGGGGSEQSSSCATALNILSGWNLVSSPVFNPVPDDSVKHLFPTAMSEAFKFTGSYVTVNMLHHGIGYWLKFPSSQTVIPEGSLLDNDTINVTTNWNMVGSISTEIATSSISSIPPGLVTSHFFAYGIGGYSISTAITPGKGYWVKVSAAGKLILSTSTAPPSSRIKIIPTDELPPAPPVAEGSHPVSQIPKEFALFQAYPNPFNPSAKIKFDLPHDSRITLKVYDLLGRVVTSLADNQSYGAGTYQIEFNAGNLASGIYFYRITAQNESMTFTDVKKMLLMK